MKDKTLRKLRAQLGLSMFQLAKKLKLKAHDIDRIERGFVVDDATTAAYESGLTALLDDHEAQVSKKA